MLHLSRYVVLAGAGICTGCVTENALTVVTATLPSVGVAVQCELKEALDAYVESTPTDVAWLEEWSAKVTLKLDAKKEGNAGATIGWSSAAAGDRVILGIGASHMGSDLRQANMVYTTSLDAARSYPCDQERSVLAADGYQAAEVANDSLGFRKVIKEIASVRATTKGEPDGVGYGRTFTLVSSGDLKPGFAQGLFLVSAGFGASKSNVSTIDVAFAPNPGKKPPIEVIIVQGRPSSDRELLNRNQDFILFDLKQSRDRFAE